LRRYHGGPAHATGQQVPVAGCRSPAANENTPRDNQQIQDDNQQSAELPDVPNKNANKEPAEGSRDHAGGISNRPFDDERRIQERVPPRGDSKEGGHA
jgi:hypothetical protein